MANNVSIELKGLNGALDRIKALVPKVRAGVTQTVAEVAYLIESDAKLLAPVDTGLLRSSIHADIAPNGLSAGVLTDVSYAPFVEFGTKRKAARPFLFPAYEKNRLAFMAALKRNLKLF